MANFERRHTLEFHSKCKRWDRPKNVDGGDRLRTKTKAERIKAEIERLKRLEDWHKDLSKKNRAKKKKLQKMPAVFIFLFQLGGDWDGSAINPLNSYNIIV